MKELTGKEITQMPSYAA